MNSEKSKGFFSGLKVRGIPRFGRRELLEGALSFAVAFVLGICPLPLSVYPLGIAFFCAASKNALYSAAGLFLASFFTPLNTAVYFLSVLLALGMRILTRIFIDVPARVEDKPELSTLLDHLNGSLFCEALSLRVASAAVTVFALSLYPIITGGFAYYDLFGAMLSIGVTIAAVPLFCGAFTDEAPRSRAKLLHRKAARIAISALICLSLGALPIKGVDLGLAAAFFFTVRFCVDEGLPEACAAALFCGAVCSLEYVAVLIIVAFTAYCVLDVSANLAAAVGCIAGSICGVMLEGGIFMADAFLSLLLGCAVFATLKKLASDSDAKKVYVSSPSSSWNEKLSLTDMVIKDAEGAVEKLEEFIPEFSCAKAIFEALRREKTIETSENKGLAKAISRRLYELGFGRVETSVTGTRHISVRISGERLAGRPERLDFIRRQVEQLTAFPLTSPRLDESGRTLTLRRDSLLSYHHAVALSSREELCGDTAEVFFDERRNMLHAVICDGMGSGETANAVSSRAASMLKALILGGLSPTEADLKLGILLSRANQNSDEVSTTADIFTLDLYDGKATLIKSGSAPSYVIRDGEIIRLSARTVPMGILKKTDYEKIEFNLRDGDIFLMASDGVSECENDSIPLLDYLNTHRASSPKEIADDVIDLSRGLGREDDLSVIAVKIFPQNY